MSGAGTGTPSAVSGNLQSAVWPIVRLGEVLTQHKEYIGAPEPREYSKLSVRLYGRGVVLDAPADGTTLKMRRHQIAHAGQVILSEIWGKKGAIGLVPPDGEGALCTSHFFLFDVRREKLTNGWLKAIFTANVLAGQLAARAFGTTGYAAVRPKDLLACGIPLPPVPEQRRIVAKLDQLSGMAEEARGLRRALSDSVDAVVSAEASKLFDNLGGHPLVPIRQLGIGEENPVQTGPFGAQLHASDFTSTGVPVLNVGNVWPEGLRLNRLDYVLPGKAAQLSRYEVRVGDLLFARSGATLGKVCLVPEQCDGWLMTGHLFRVRFDPTRVLNRFGADPIP